MGLEQEIMEKMKLAMKAKDQVSLRTLRAIKSAILLEKTKEGGDGTFAEDDAIKMLSKLAKQRRDSAALYNEQNRPDLAKTEEEELAVIEQFLPAQMDDAALSKVVADIITQTGAAGMQDMGKVMGLAMKKVAGQADGKVISAKVKELLSA
ncbi:UNVERIFIED_CONTAM: hypothetical protein GTU68_046375 [Idotea baltica]|nr:hypothetical protein [Idotea baltica]